MSQIALHLNQDSIADDMEFYLTDRWDKHNQIRPSPDIVNLTADSKYLVFAPGKVSNFLYPLPNNSFERIYIGPSVPLFSNQWGVAFLIQLMKLLAPDGAIILPVHPEGRAHEKGWWCRSALESSLQNRTGLTGISNIRAENDGVMSLRVGCRWPKHVASTIDWFFRERGTLLLNQVVSGDLNRDDIPATFVYYAQAFWLIASQSALIEHIIQNHFGAKSRGKSLSHFNADNSLLSIELAVNQKLKLGSAQALLKNAASRSGCAILARDFLPHTQQRFNILDATSAKSSGEKADIALLINEGSDPMDADAAVTAWATTSPGGLLIWLDDWDKHDKQAMLATLHSASAPRYYAIDTTSEIQGPASQRAFCILQKT